MKLTVNAPINSLSFGNVSTNILRQLYKKNTELTFFPIGDNVEISAFNKIKKDFVDYLQNSTNKRFETTHHRVRKKRCNIKKAASHNKDLLYITFAVLNSTMSFCK